MNCGLTWPVGISIIFQRPLTVSLHSPYGRQMPAIRAVQGDCERVYTITSHHRDTEIPAEYNQFHLLVSLHNISIPSYNLIHST